MEKSELKGVGNFTADFLNKKTAYGLKEAYTTAAVVLGAFLVGRVTLFGILSTLAAAVVFCFVGDGRRFYGVWGAAFFSVLLSGTGDLWRYAANFVFAMITDMLLKDRDGISPVRKSVLCAFCVIVTGAVKYLAVQRLDFVIFITLLEAMVAFFSVYAFCGAKKAVEKGRFLSGEGIMYVIFAISVTAAGFGKITVKGVDLFIVAATFSVMYFSFINPLSGVAVGGALGLASLFSGFGDLSLLGAFVIMGISAGFFKSLGKGAVAATSVFCGCALLFYAGGDYFGFETVLAMIIAVGMFFVFPATFFIENGVVSGEDGYDVFKDLSSKRMAEVSAAVKSISEALYTVSGEVSEKERIDRIIDSTVSCVCGDCGLSAYCWGSEIEATYKGFYKFTGECGKNGSVKISDMPEEIAKNCVRLKAVTETTNRNLDFYRQDMVWDMRIKEYKAADRKRMEIISKTLNELSDFMENEFKPDKKLTAKAVAAVKDKVKKPVKIKGYSVNGISGIYAIGAGFDLSEIISAMGEEKFALTGSSSKGEEADIYTALPRFKASFAVAGKAKTGNDVTGDSFGDVCTKKGISIILSDGMGTGQEARNASMKTVELAESLFKAELSGETVTSLIDTVFLNGMDMFATADIFETDLYEGKAKFVKTGAAASFVLRDGKIKTVKASSLPPGLMLGEKGVTEINLRDGDIIIMMTDGVTEALSSGKEESEWVKEVFESLNSKDPRFIADSIIKEAERLRGIAGDDMTAAVIRIWEPI